MWVIIIICLILFVVYKLGRALFKPIFDFVYDLILSIFTGMGMSDKAAKALVSVIIIVIILIWLS